ncbi:IQ calmodulin-binding protein, putative [Bodo saltans]|uniref:IQ calmodulin-binding protein, putative n=1 Tax=Bodo saltans TaxID=75058 RepID=A0A0S4JTE4_BODSA|nr:IQ calmodulin-binding protein, putative [Bodo saltans]|eukprot:CUG93656.1 IQ calmodulin-binding protein, putative [Bodo saltans]
MRQSVFARSTFFAMWFLTSLQKPRAMLFFVIVLSCVPSHCETTYTRGKKMSVLSDLDDDVHMSSYIWQGNGWRRTKPQKKWLIGVGRDRLPVSAYLLAAVELQRFWRGILLRRRVLKKYISASFVRAWKQEEQVVLRAYRATPRAPEAAFGELVKRVQAQWRTALLRAEFDRWEHLQRWPIYWVAAATIQRAWVDFQYHRNLKRHRNRSKRIYKTKADHAAGKIQHMWKGYIHKRIFKFFVALIKFREQGDPALMLKCIDPGEAAMMDKAAGLHVRFRLAGAHFPPIIVYKVFTHNNVADVGSFAPKDYASRKKETQKQTPAVLHNTTHQRSRDNRNSWYQRVDNNFWRPVDMAVLKNAEDIAHLQQTQATKHADIIPQGSAYHYSRLRRQVDKEIKGKQTRRLWLAELYSSEQCRHRPTYEHSTVKNDAKKIFFSMGEHEVDEEVQRLTDWTDQLDFESYRRDWLRQATTAGSDTKLLIA